MPPKFPLITLEEHIFTPSEWESLPQSARDGMRARDPEVHNKLLDVGAGRIADMDANSVSVQVLSIIPRHPDDATMVRLNNDLRAIKDKNPTRFQAFACLSLYNPVRAAEELERCVKELGFLGALFPNQLDDGSFYDTAKYYPFWAKAEELDVPIYLHPCYPSPEMSKYLYEGPFSKATATHIGAWCYGWHSTIAVHILRLFAAGIFDRFPKLKIVIGHMGETLPFMLDRILPQTLNWPENKDRKRGLREVWDNNIWITTSGMFTLAPMACLLKTTKIDRILYSVDYPLETNSEGLSFLRQLKNSGLVTEADMELIGYKNAQNLLKFKA